MEVRFHSVDSFKRLAQTGREAGAAVSVLSAPVRAVDERARAASFVFSDQSIDRAGDRIFADGWRLENYRRNPVALFGHDATALPIGKSPNVKIAGSQLLGTILFAPPELSDFAHRCFGMVKGGFLSCVSVGFRPIRWEWAKDATRPMGINFIEQELLEISVVPIPANARALLLGAQLGDAEHQTKVAKRRRQIQLLRLQDGP